MTASCLGEAATSQPVTPAESSTTAKSPLDCGKGVAGSEDAVRQFLAILSDGKRAEVRSVLATDGRFWRLSVNGKRRHGPHFNPSPRDRAKTARAVARRDGLPIEVTSFLNSEPPRRTTDIGFKGRWNGRRGVIGKVAIDCNQGRAIVLAAAVRRR
jgi:hypothetical protein